MKDESIDLVPGYSTEDIPGKCLKCLAEQKLDTCLRELLRKEGEDKPVQRRYEALLAFLQSPESEKLRKESEQYLADGKQVTVSVCLEDGKPRYELRVRNSEELTE